MITESMKLIHEQELDPQDTTLTVHVFTIWEVNPRAWVAQVALEVYQHATATSWVEHFVDSYDRSLVGRIAELMKPRLPRLVYLKDMTVHEEHRGHDLGRRLLRHALETLQVAGETLVFLLPVPYQEVINISFDQFQANLNRLVQYYERMGFTCKPIADEYGESQIVMWAPLEIVLLSNST